MRDGSFESYSIGGDGFVEGVDKYMEDRKAKRFKPVALFRGPLATDENGKAVLNFDMPNYMGAVRFMVVAADQDRYGSRSKTVPVKTDLILSQSLPRVLSPGDVFQLPVTVITEKTRHRGCRCEAGNRRTGRCHRRQR